MRGKKLLFCLFCLLFVFSALPAFAAGVTLAKDDYVYLGAFKHINTIDTTYPLVEVSGDYDLSATPVLWQVRSMDAVSSPTQAYLFSRYIVAQRWWTALAKVPTPFRAGDGPYRLDDEQRPPRVAEPRLSGRFQRQRESVYERLVRDESLGLGGRQSDAAVC